MHDSPVPDLIVYALSTFSLPYGFFYAGVSLIDTSEILPKADPIAFSVSLARRSSFFEQQPSAVYIFTFP
jgi:hypothetical protein